MKRLATCCALLIIPVVASAQWLHYPTPEVPRTADGKPDLAAPAPRLFDDLWR